MKKLIILLSVTLCLFLSIDLFSGTVTGNIRYLDRTFYLSGFTGTEYKPVRYTDIEIRRYDNNNILGSGYTDNNGNYNISIPDSGYLDIYLLIIAKSYNSPFTDVVVKDDVYSQNIQAVASPQSYENTDSDIVFDFDIQTDDGTTRIGDPFNIIDCVLLSAEKIYNETGSTVPLVTVYWKDGSGDGSYYTGSTIHLLGGTPGSPDSGDNDGYDDSVIIHEYGHFIADNYSVDKSPGGSHSTIGYYNPKLTWSEGWATFLNLAVRNSCVYWDSSGTGGFSIDYETPSPYANLRIGMNNESAISCVLYDIYDNSSSEDDTLGTDDDPYSLGFSEIWTIVDDFMDNNNLTATFDDFYNGWKSTYPSLNVDSAFVDRSIEFVPWNSSEKIYERTYLYLGIPDNNPSGVMDTISVNANSIVDTVKVFVDVDHFDLTDLEISLSSPDATSCILHNNTLSSDNVLIEWYGFSNYDSPPESLDIFKDKNTLGDWQITIKDTGPGFSGELVSYKLKIKLESTFSENWFIY